MTAYGYLAPHYDALMRGMDYGAYAETLLSLAGNPLRVLDLACGTGRLAEELCGRGCDVVAVDSSPEMLSVAQGRDCGALFLQQDMTELDLYGTVEAAFCTLDALNYLPSPQKLKRAFSRVRLFLEPGGAFIFDMLTPEALAARDGAVYMSDAEDAYCVWRCAWKAPYCRQEVTLFARQGGGLWKRYDETHTERAYAPGFVTEALREAGFAETRRRGMETAGPPREDDERIVFVAV
ncbi:MAG: methyltransferase domain-containing protein [Oscillospiraceae bacterium]|jgi:SAM-dependent methyltransferase|nr:methyltransferase domain-containing protein [Oscillospiraceae bacterium]